MSPAASFITQPTPTTPEAPKVVLGYDPKNFTESNQTTESSTSVETPTQPKSTSKEDSERAHKLAQLAKTERKLQTEAQKSNEIIKKAESLKEAFQSTNIVEQIEKLGFDPIEVYKTMTKQLVADREPDKTPEQLREEQYEAKLKSLEDSLVKIQNEVVDKDNSIAKQKILDRDIIPSIDLELHGTAINIFGSKEAFIEKVYAQMEDEYITNGKLYSAKVMADSLEEYYYNQMTAALDNAKKINKFSKYFQNEKEITSNDSNNETLSRSERLERVLSDFKKENLNTVEQETESPKTLTNNMNINSERFSTPANSRKEQIRMFLKKT